MTKVDLVPERCITWMQDVIKFHKDILDEEESNEYENDVIKECKYIIECVEKQIPKKPIILTEDFDGIFKYPVCPNCKNDDIVDVYCSYCGQAIDWSDENE